MRSRDREKGAYTLSGAWRREGGRCHEQRQQEQADPRAVTAAEGTAGPWGQWGRRLRQLRPGAFGRAGSRRVLREKPVESELGGLEGEDPSLDRSGGTRVNRRRSCGLAAGVSP